MDSVDGWEWNEGDERHLARSEPSGDSRSPQARGIESLKGTDAMPTVIRQSKPRKPFTPATGTCRRSIQPSMTGASGVLLIKTTRSMRLVVAEAYTVEESRDRERLLGYRLVKPAGTIYDLPVDLTECSCPDYTINGVLAETEDFRNCKHCRGLKEALVKLGN